MLWHLPYMENPPPMPKVKRPKDDQSGSSWYGVRPESQTPPMPPTAAPLTDVDRDFVVMYKMLNAVEQGMDSKDSARLPTAAELGVTENRRAALINILSDAGYLFIMRGKTLDGILVERPPWLTLKGLEYLWNSPQMQRAAQMAQREATGHV